MNLTGLELGIAVYGTIMVYLSFLGAFILHRSRIIRIKGISIIVGFSFLLWAASILMYFYFPPSITVVIKTVIVYIILILGIVIYARYRRSGMRKQG